MVTTLTGFQGTSGAQRAEPEFLTTPSQDLHARLKIGWIFGAHPPTAAEMVVEDYVMQKPRWASAGKCAVPTRRLSSTALQHLTTAAGGLTCTRSIAASPSIAKDMHAHKPNSQSEMELRRPRGFEPVVPPPGSGVASKTRGSDFQLRAAFSGERLGTLWEGRREGSRPTPCGEGQRPGPQGGAPTKMVRTSPGSNSLGEAAAPPRGREGALGGSSTRSSRCGIGHGKGQPWRLAASQLRPGP